MFPMSDVARMSIINGQRLFLIEAVLLVGSRYVWFHVRSTVDLLLPIAAAVPRPASDAVVGANLAAKLVAVLVVALAHFSFFAGKVFHGDDPLWICVLSYVCVGAEIQFIFVLFCANRAVQVCRWIAKKRKRKSSSCPSSLAADCIAASRRQAGGSDYVRRDGTGKIACFCIAVAYTTVMCLYGVYSASQPPAVKTVEIVVDGLPRSMDNTRVALLSDIHLGPTVGLTKMEMIAQMVNDLNPGFSVL